MTISQIIYFAFALFLFFILGGIVLVLVLRRKAGRQILSDPDFAGEIAIEKIQNPTEKDLLAEKIILEETEKVWRRIGLDTSIHPKTVFNLCIDLNQRIASVYFPDTENPELRATLHDLNELVFRISQNIRAQLESFPFNKIKDLNVDQLLRIKDWYDRFNSHELLQFLKSKLKYYKFGSHLWGAINLTNPWYWGRRVLMTFTQEALIRYFLVMILITVGNEARRVYGGRLAPSTREAGEIQAIKELWENGSESSPSEKLKFVLNQILKNKKLHPELKIQLCGEILNDNRIQTAGTDNGLLEGDQGD